MDMTVPVVVVKEDETYIAKDMNTSVVSQGSTVEGAIASLKEALELYYDGSDETPGYPVMFTTTLEICV